MTRLSMTGIPTCFAEILRRKSLCVSRVWPKFRFSAFFDPTNPDPMHRATEFQLGKFSASGLLHARALHVARISMTAVWI